jgi:hypothetical protein
MICKWRNPAVPARSRQCRAAEMPPRLQPIGSCSCVTLPRCARVSCAKSPGMPTCQWHAQRRGRAYDFSHPRQHFVAALGNMRACCRCTVLAHAATVNETPWEPPMHVLAQTTKPLAQLNHGPKASRSVVFFLIATNAIEFPRDNKPGQRRSLRIGDGRRVVAKEASRMAL